MTETTISRERAKAILDLVGQSEEYVPGADYYIVTDEDNGYEHLVIASRGDILAVNSSTTSWLGSGLPR